MKIADPNERGRFFAASDLIPNVFWHAHISPNGKIIEAHISDNIDALLELPAGTVNNKFDIILKYVHPDDSQKLETIVQKKLTKAGKLEETYRLISRFGKEIQVFTNGIIREKSHSEGFEAYGVTTDMSVLRKKQLSKEKNEHKFKALINILSYPVIIHQNNKIKFLNTAAIEFIGADAEQQAVGLKLAEFIHPDDKDEFCSVLKNAMSEEKRLYSEQKRFVALNDDIKYAEINGMPFIDTDGEKAVLLALNDISDKVKAQMDLQESEARYKALFELSPFPVVVHSGSKILLANKKAAEIMGVESPEDAKGLQIFNYIHPDSFEKVKKRIEKIYKTGKSLPPVQERFIGKNNEILEMEVASSPLLYENRKAVLAVLNDITERENSRKKLEELIATKDRFFSIIAHDLKNPFHQILGFGEVVNNEPEEFDLEQTQKIVHYMYDSARKGYALLENLLEWSRAQTGSLKFAPQAIRIDELIRSEIEFIMPNAKAKEIDLKLSEIAKENLIFGDKDMLKTVIRNLLSNAVKFTFRGGEINISAKKKNPDMLEVKIRDNGIGIPPDKAEKLFLPGESSTQPGTENEAGTGLGLLLCHEFVKRNGGEIIAESLPGKGSVFRFSVPLYNGQASKPDFTARKI